MKPRTLSSRYFWQIIVADIVLAGVLIAAVWPNLAPASLASATALIIAFVAYPWQKQQDRALKLAEEKRVAYSQFFEAAEGLHACLIYSDASENSALLEQRALFEAKKLLVALSCGRRGIDAISSYCGDMAVFARRAEVVPREMKITAAREFTFLDSQGAAEEIFHPEKIGLNGYRFFRSFKAVRASWPIAVANARRDCELTGGHPQSDDIKRLYDVPVGFLGWAKPAIVREPTAIRAGESSLT